MIFKTKKNTTKKDSPNFCIVGRKMKKNKKEETKEKIATKISKIKYISNRLKNRDNLRYRSNH